MLFVIDKLKSTLKEVGAGAPGAGAQATWAPQHPPLFLHWDPWSGSAPGPTADPHELPGLTPGVTCHSAQVQLFTGRFSQVYCPHISLGQAKSARGHPTIFKGPKGEQMAVPSGQPGCGQRASRCPLPTLSGCSPSRNELGGPHIINYQNQQPAPGPAQPSSTSSQLRAAQNPRVWTSRPLSLA